MIEGMKMMTHWHTDSFNACPIGDGYEVEVNEFDYRDDNGVCYDKDGVTSATGGGRTSRTAPRPTGSTGTGCRSSGPGTAGPTSSR